MGGVAQFVEVTNTTNPGGAVVAAGLAKIITVIAIPAVFNPLPYEIVVAIVTVITVVAVIVLLHRRKRSKAK